MRHHKYSALLGDLNNEGGKITAPTTGLADAYEGRGNLSMELPNTVVVVVAAKLHKVEDLVMETPIRESGSTSGRG